MTESNSPNHTANQNSLLTDDERSGLGQSSAAKSVGPVQAFITNARAAMNSPAFLRNAAITIGVTAFAIGTVMYIRSLPTPTPDIASDDMYTVLDFTMLDASYNRLSIDERIALAGDLMKRMRRMSTDDAIALADFATRINGDARDQFEENVSRLMVDMMDTHAVNYDPAADETERVEQLQAAYVEVHRTISTIFGGDDDMTDEERLAWGQRNEERQMDAMDNGDLSGEQAGAMFSAINDGLGKHASLHQRARVSVMMRDMTRVLRGQDVKTGTRKP